MQALLCRKILLKVKKAAKTLIIPAEKVSCLIFEISDVISFVFDSHSMPKVLPKIYVISCIEFFKLSTMTHVRSIFVYFATKSGQPASQAKGFEGGSPAVFC